VAAVNRKPRGWSRLFSIGTLEPSYRTVDRYTEALFMQFLPADVALACLDVKPVRLVLNSERAQSETSDPLE
jgi:hypothetical protein